MTTIKDILPRTSAAFKRFKVSWHTSQAVLYASKAARQYERAGLLSEAMEVNMVIVGTPIDYPEREAKRQRRVYESMSRPITNSRLEERGR